MPRIFQTGYYYHIYNRGVEKRKIFLDRWDYVRFLECLRYFNQEKAIGNLRDYKKAKETGFRNLTQVSKTCQDSRQSCLVDILAYCLNPNHYHLLLKQKREDGIYKFLKKIGIGYTNYFNKKYNRNGYLFQGKYKYKEIQHSEGLKKLSVYVNCNAEIHGIAMAKDWPWSSYLDYAGLRNGSLCDKKDILEEYRNISFMNLCESLLPEIKAVKDFEKYGIE